MGADALLRGHEQIGGIEPLVERDMAALEQSADRDRELLAALIAHVEASAGRCAAYFRGPIKDAAMRARATIDPQFRLKPFAGLVCVLEDWVVEICVHGRIPVLIGQI